jgi:hypothetical protein
LPREREQAPDEFSGGIFFVRGSVIGFCRRSQKNEDAAFRIRNRTKNACEGRKKSLLSKISIFAAVENF